MDPCSCTFLGPCTWINTLNEQSLWRSDADAIAWFAKLSGKKNPELGPSSLKIFSNSLCSMRNVLYSIHFEENFDLTWLQDELAELKLVFEWPPVFGFMPVLRGKSDTASDEGLLESLRGGLLMQFASDLAQSLLEGTAVQRCEGLYRDDKAQQISIVPEVREDIEQKWRQEIPVLVEKAIVDTDVEIQRCADFFLSTKSRSKYCSDPCRFSTFQIVKQLKEPEYLAEKQRRYRKKRSD